MKYFEKIANKNKLEGINILTVTASFPSLIQPWLVNHLIQIKANGGENRIVSRRASFSEMSQAIKDHGFLDRYVLLPESKKILLLQFLKSFLNPMVIKRLPRLLLGYHRRNEFSSFKSYVFDLLVLPAFTVDVDIIHSHSEPVGSKFLPLIKANKSPLVVTFHGLQPKGVTPISDQSRKAYSDYAEVILVNTQFAKSQYEKLGAPSNKIEVIPQGVDLNYWPFTPAAYPEKAGSINLLTVARFTPEKGHKYALEAISKLKNDGVNITYTMIGGGPLLVELKGLANNLGIGDICDFQSEMTNTQIRAFYQRSHIFLLPSLKAKESEWEETQGVVLQEAQATGLITIATKTGGIPECIDDGVSGFLVNDRDAEALYQTIDNIISNPDKWANWQNLGRKWVEDNFCAKKIGKRMNKLYNSVLQRVE